MRPLYALCEGGGLRICDSCRRNADFNPGAARNPHQPWVTAPRGPRCPHWLAKPHTGAITPTDKR